MAQTAEQETARQLISEASQKLSEAVRGKANHLQGGKVAQAMLSHYAILLFYFVMKFTKWVKKSLSGDVHCHGIL